MRIHFCGVRGSMPAAGQDFVRYGGNTSCVAVAHAGERPRLVLDAGTGLTTLAKLLGGDPFVGSILLGHLHWDHVTGLPFFRADDDTTEVSVFVPEQGQPADAILERLMSPPLFPITPHELRGRWTFQGIDEGEHEIEGFRVTAREIPHKGGRTFGYRISDGDRALAYLSDHHPRSLGRGVDGGGPYHDAARALADGVDVLIHDAQYTTEEYATRSEYGHATFDYAIGLAQKCGVATLVLYHHDPQRTDDQLDRIVADLPETGIDILAAVEGEKIDL